MAKYTEYDSSFTTNIPRTDFSLFSLIRFPFALQASKPFFKLARGIYIYIYGGSTTPGSKLGPNLVPGVTVEYIWWIYI